MLGICIPSYYMNSLFASLYVQWFTILTQRIVKKVDNALPENIPN